LSQKPDGIGALQDEFLRLRSRYVAEESDRNKTFAA
jgi:hypothetical protein